MSWNGKKFWRIYEVENNKLYFAGYTSRELAEHEAEKMAGLHKETFLVLEVVSGFHPKQDTERVKFK